MALFKSARSAAKLPPSPHICRLLEVGCAADEETAYRQVAPHLIEKYKAYFSWGLEGLKLDPNATPDQQFRSLAVNRFAVGTPQQVADMLVAQHALGITHLSMRMSWPGMGQKETLASIELVGRKVLPEVRRRTARGLAGGPADIMMRVAFDIGGTFTDFVLEDARAGALHFHKVPTTPGDPAKAVLDGLESLLRAAKVGFAEVSGILHATTVATNAILERKGARTALITTAGFRDIVIIGRQKRYDTYDMYLAKPVPLVRRRDIFEVARAHAGRRHDRAAARYRRRSIVLWSRSPPATTSRSPSACCTPTPRPRTRRPSARRSPAPSVPPAVSLSSDLSPKFREYERASTVVANAYIKPIVSRYVSRLTGALKERGLTLRPLHHAVERRPRVAGARLRHADPHRRVRARGRRAAVRRHRPRGRPRPRAHLRHGRHHRQARRHRRRRARHHADLRGRPGALPQGQRPAHQRPGRRAPGDRRRRRQHRRDRHGAHQGRPGERRRRSGPRLLRPRRRHGRPSPTPMSCSATSIPTTSTAAPCGSMRRPPPMPLRERIGKPLGLDAGEAAWGIHRIANANMERAMRIVSVERGRDPRKYALVAFGGAGPLHAARLARALGIPQVIIPFGAGVGSAIGMLEANSKLDASMTRLLRLGRRRRDRDRGHLPPARRRACAPILQPHERGRRARHLALRLPALRRPGPRHPRRPAAVPGAGRLCRRRSRPASKQAYLDQIRLPTARRRGGGRRLVHRRLGRRARRPAPTAPRAGAAQASGSFRRGTRKAYFPKPAAMSTAPSSTAALCPSARSSRAPPSSRRRKPPRCCCPAPPPPSAPAATSS